jgi:protease-4
MSRRKWVWVGIGIGSIVCILVPLICVGLSTLSLSGGASAGRVWEDAVAVVRIEGVIVSGREPSFPISTSDSAYSESIIQRLERAQDDPSVKAIVLRVNSPGGGIVASDEVFNALNEVDKPVVVSMGELAASGGYYVSCAAEKIIANPMTLTGGIGVISTFPNFEQLLDKIGVDMLVIKSGAMKDQLSPYREPTEEEIAHWQEITDEAYGRFLSIVAEARELDLEEAQDLADGRVYTGQHALDLGLVDALGDLPDAIADAAKLGGIEGEPRLIQYEQAPSLLEMLLSGIGSFPSLLSVDDFLGIERRFTVQYLYIGP